MATTRVGQEKSYTFLVEHLDPELEEWQALEYNTINKESEATKNKFLLSGLSPSFAGSKGLSLPESSKTSNTAESMYPGEAKQRVCLLDPKAEKDIGPEDAELFDAFLFGGILGDDPPRDRTGDLRKLGFPGRRLGPEQMTTDTAVRVTRMVIRNKSQYFVIRSQQQSLILLQLLSPRFPSSIVLSSASHQHQVQMESRVWPFTY